MRTEKKAMPRVRMAGLVLAGGRSRRFGREKATALWQGRPLLAWSLAALEGECEAVAVSAAPGSGAESLARAAGRVVLHDDPGHAAGPLAGLAVGLAWAASGGFDAVATLPCDTPMVEPAQIRALVGALGEAQGAYAVTEDGSHGLCAVWRCMLAPVLAARLAAGDHPPVHRLLAEIGSRPVRFTNAGLFGNINTEPDLAGLRRASPPSPEPPA